MARLRKMLGNVDDPSVVSLMRMIETQSKATLASWAIGYAGERFLAIYERTEPHDRRPHELIAAAKEYLAGTKTAAEIKQRLKEAQTIANGLEANPAAQAAARAVVTACGTIQTPTNALGFAFYGAAAVAYDQFGLSAGRDVYDPCAAAELARIEASLKAVLVDGEPNPVKVNWNC